MEYRDLPDLPELENIELSDAELAFWQDVSDEVPRNIEMKRRNPYTNLIGFVLVALMFSAFAIALAFLLHFSQCCTYQWWLSSCVLWLPILLLTLRGREFRMRRWKFPCL